MLRLTYVGKIRALDLTVRTIQTERRAEGGVQVLLTRPYLIAILEATTRFAAAPLRDARAPIVKWNAQDAGVEDLSKCGLADRDQVSLRCLGARRQSDAGGGFRAAAASFDPRDLQAPA